ncbi:MULTISPECIES: response regulator [Brevundimonas]|jgi:signal transduction histidine kinase/ActR/RegA family two-component response regulator|uniref:histidine kinase n=1 Tax=Brevundimonas halotolerans TaxID=69670 RepID=A0A7W9E958_9CAUL|nr:MULTISPECIES: response regulator [Brevundimonas]MAL88010.1 response regulator receiver protein [Brevundimonas sp.]MBB5661465.1 signal transduction histidine kinase/CheY-like chemotaxis protein [Brevundimonas halotolerans]|tara:strand:+ start:20964 stop:22589 length:1626 start_codon:yes stop_codon:yes gene_type:complete
MPTIEKLTERATPVPPETLGAAIFAHFKDFPDALVIPVVKDDRPVGLIERNAFLLKVAGPFGHALYGNRPITELMDDEPSVVEAGVRIDSFCDAMLSSGPGALTRGFIVTRKGKYWGIGTVISLLKAINDDQRRQNAELTEQARMLSDTRTQALSAARAKSQFLSIMSHELRTPLNGVLAVAELLRRQPLNAAAQSHVQTIVDSSEVLLQILQDALDLSRAEAGELDINLQPTPLRALMDDVAAMWEPRASQDNVHLVVSYEGDTELAAKIDPVRIKQIFNNLIGNALKFARNGMVEAGLKAWIEGDRVVMQARVRDDGPGVPADRVDVIFEPFVHGSGPDGAGLGLAICRQIMDRLDGRIWAENNPGRGATFAFDISAERAERPVEADSNVSDMVESDMIANPHILIVDDNATNRVVAQALCEMFGCTSETADDGMEALDAIKERDFDLVLMDIKMPRMDGLQATQAIRKLKGPMRDVPIIALTANADPEDARRYIASGMAAVVEKPIKPERLRHAMNAALSAPQVEDEAMADGPQVAAG